MQSPPLKSELIGPFRGLDGGAAVEHIGPISRIPAQHVDLRADCASVFHRGFRFLTVHCILRNKKRPPEAFAPGGL